MENYTTHDNSVTERYNSSSGNKAATTGWRGCQTAPSSGTVSVQTAAARRSNSTVGDCRRLGRTRTTMTIINQQHGCDCRRLVRIRPTTTIITAKPWQWNSLDSNRSLRTLAEPPINPQMPSWVDSTLCGVKRDCNFVICKNFCLRFSDFV